MDCEVLVHSEMPQHPKTRPAIKTNTQRKYEGLKCSHKSRGVSRQSQTTESLTALTFSQAFKSAVYTIKASENDLKGLSFVSFVFKSVPPGFRRTFFWFLRPKKTDFAVAFLKICIDICGISYCFAVKIYHGQHSSNMVITFLTSRTIVGLQTNIWGHQCH